MYALITFMEFELMLLDLWNLCFLYERINLCMQYMHLLLHVMESEFVNYEFMFFHIWSIMDSGSP